MIHDDNARKLYNKMTKNQRINVHTLVIKRNPIRRIVQN